MARLDRSFVRLRFRFGEGNVKGRQRYTNTAAFIARRVAFTYAENLYDDARRTLEYRVAMDARRELVNLASLYRRHIVGANGNLSQPAGVIKGVIGNQIPLSLSSALPSWAPRNARYLKRKQASAGHINWFDNRGWQGGGRGRRGWRPDDVGLLFKESRAETWETMFGPIRVVFRKSRQLQQGQQLATITVGKGPKTEVQIGTLMVYAMSRITPEMLPALRRPDGRIPKASDSGNQGLMGLIGQWDKRLAYRLGRRSAGTKRYRPTLEPFLSYFLTRSIPAAVQRRISETTLKRVVRGS